MLSSLSRSKTYGLKDNFSALDEDMSASIPYNNSGIVEIPPEAYEYELPQVIRADQVDEISSALSELSLKIQPVNESVDNTISSLEDLATGSDMRFTGPKINIPLKKICTRKLPPITEPSTEDINTVPSPDSPRNPSYRRFTPSGQCPVHNTKSNSRSSKSTRKKHFTRKSK